MTDRREGAREADETLELLQEVIDSPAIALRLEEVGRVVEVGLGIAIVTGLDHVLADEMVLFASGGAGIVSDLEPGRLGVILLRPAEGLAAGEDVYRTRKVVSAPVGDGLLGRVVDAVGRPLDEKGPLGATLSAPVEARAPAILERSMVSRPLATGIKVIDAAIPIGRGQRQLIIGDRQTGKTSIAVDTMLNQAGSGVICIYCAIGQRGDAVARVIGALGDGGMMDQSIVMSASSEDAPGLSFIAPYAATSMAEHFLAQGRDVLLVYDDLTRHARAYRELSLLLRRPPGREAFPGDIFYVHARLLERAGQLSAVRGGGSLTALPVIETQAENLSGYIPTNLISITDGQVYLSPRLVQKGQFPAVDTGKSVSRVGGKAQSPAFRAIAGDLRVTLSQFEELENFARFGTRLDENTRARLKRGKAVRAAMRQPERDPVPAPGQLAILLAVMDGLMDDVDESRFPAVMDAIRAAVVSGSGGVAERILSGAPFGEDDRETLLALAREAIMSVERKDNDRDI